MMTMALRRRRRMLFQKSRTKNDELVLGGQSSGKTKVDQRTKLMYFGYNDKSQKCTPTL